MTTDPRDAEIARLNQQWEDHDAAWSERVAVLTVALHKTEAERDAALAQVTRAYETAAEFADEWDTIERLLPFMDDKSNACAHTGQHEARERIANGIRALTPAHALAARDRRDVQMRAEGRKEGLREAADMAKHGFHPRDILAAAEKEKGNG